MTYPYEAGEAERFVPSAFADMKDPPTFWLRNGTPREKRRQRRMMFEEGLRIHGTDVLRAELLKGMEDLFGEDDYAKWMPQAKAYWDAIDSFEQEHKDTAQKDIPDFVFEGQAAIDEVIEQVRRDWRPYRLLMADNMEQRTTMPQIEMAVIVERFENIEVEPRVEARYLTLDTALEIEEALGMLASTPLPKGVPHPSVELRGECQKRLYLTQAQVKNSESPSPSDPTPKDTATGPASKRGKSKASASSKKTPATS